MPTVVIGSANKHKIKEFREILGVRFSLLDATAFPSIPEVIEDGKTFTENASKKAIEFAIHTFNLCKNGVFKFVNFPVYFVADDSGLEVDALNGAPGVYSARFAGSNNKNTRDAENNKKLLDLLKDVPAGKRSARFRCVIAAVEIKQSDFDKSMGTQNIIPLSFHVEFFEGVCEGVIGFEPRGSCGFGYDPLFYPIGYNKTFAELGEEVKNKISHRARALEAFARWVKGSLQ